MRAVQRCGGCGQIKPASDFSPEPSRSTGLARRCRPCANTRARERYARAKGSPVRPVVMGRTPEEKRAIQAERNRLKNVSRHGGPDEWARMYAEQGGLCYMCRLPLSDDRSTVHVDHDHDCCDPGFKGRHTDSCSYCRRGLAHERCNQIWGLAKEDADLLRAIADNADRERIAAKLRIASKVPQLTLL